VNPEHSERVSQLLEFLAAYDAKRNPPVHNIADYKLELLRDNELPNSSAVRLTGGGEVWLTVDFVALPPRPPVPEHLVAVLGPSSQLSATTRPVVTLPEEPTDNDLGAALEAEAWVKNLWDPWSLCYREASEVKRLHRRLFELREQYAADRDALELVWGFGRLRWRPDGLTVIDHPLLSVPVEVEMAENTAQITIRPSGGLTVETTYLSDIDVVDNRPQLLQTQKLLLEQEQPEDPWIPETHRDLALRLLRAIDQDGVLEGEGAAGPYDAVADLSWMLFLQRRRPDYQGFLNSMRDLYKNGVAPPNPLVAIVSDAPSELEKPRDGNQQRLTDDSLLLPLETNEQQRRILTEIQHRTGITVQGPPGTGKSHTIANIVSHYVAYGKRVLVVAEKEQTLGVLAEKIPPGIRALAVSVLGADDVGRRLLESSIRTIQTRVANLDRTDANNAITQLSDKLERINRGIATIKNQLSTAREGEVVHIPGLWQAGENPSPSAAARWLAENAHNLDYIDDHVALSTPPPFTGGDLAQLIELLDTVGLARARQAILLLPDAALLPDRPTIEGVWSELRDLRASMNDAGGDTVDWTTIDATDDQQLGDLAEKVEQERTWLAAASGTWLERLAGHLADSDLAPGWQQFVAKLTETRKGVIALSENLDAHSVSVPEHFEPSFTAHIEAAVKRLTEKGKLGWFDGNQKHALEACLVDGRIPSTAAAARLCLDVLRRLELRRRACTLWDNRVVQIGGPGLDAAQPEIALGHLLQDITRIITRPGRWQTLRSELQQAGIRTQTSLDVAMLADLAHIIRSTRHRRRERQLQQNLDQIHDYLSAGAVRESASPLWLLLRDRLTAADGPSWERARSEAADLTRVASDSARLLDLHRHLSAAAPRWTARVCEKPTASPDPSTFEAAWEWRQLENHLAAKRAANDPSALQRKLEELADERRGVVADLVAERAWLRLADQLGDSQIQALNAYLQAVKRYGKTGGKYAARWLAEIRQALDDSKDAVPVWIMTTSRALTSFRPAETPPFDLLIVDEASQIGMQALPLFSLAHSAIIVGDDKQTSPENVGADQSRFFDLLDQYLQRIPHYRTLFNLDNSLYDIANQKFPAQTMLTEHFRSLPEIIEFSNTHIYDGKIVPLRDQPPTPGWRPLGAVKVIDGYRSGDINEPEAAAVVDLIEKLCADPKYEDMTFGVVSLLGSSQSKLIWDRLYDRLGPDVLTARRLRCGEPANFQGDERDVMVLSLVAETPSNPTGRLRGAMTKLSDERRINVAASRARDQMWVVHSIDAGRFPPGDLRGALIRHCQAPGELREHLDVLLGRCESPFEKDVVTKILARGYRRVRVQHTVNQYRIDIVVEGPDGRLAVECDGDRWHGPERWEQDRARQEVLERAGWTFERIRGSAFYRTPDAALEPLWRRLEELNIPTGDVPPQPAARSTVIEVAGAGLAKPSAVEPVE
jgi:very-short-patch-repair endonuclease